MIVARILSVRWLSIMKSAYNALTFLAVEQKLKKRDGDL